MQREKALLKVAAKFPILMAEFSRYDETQSSVDPVSGKRLSMVIWSLELQDSALCWRFTCDGAVADGGHEYSDNQTKAGPPTPYSSLSSASDCQVMLLS
jgi:hypothetical protein